MASGKICESFDAAVAAIPSGSSIMVGGFGPGFPRNVIAALQRAGTKGLTVICNNPGDRSGRVDINGMIRAGQVAKVVCSFVVAGDLSDDLQLEGFEGGSVPVELVPQGTLAERIRAGGAGIPAFYTPVGAGTAVAKGKESRDFGARPYLLEHALTADYALVRAWRADTAGNLVYRRTQRNFNPLMARAASKTIVEVEEPVEAAGALDPDTVHTPGIFVDTMVQIPAAPDGIWEKPWPFWE